MNKHYNFLFQLALVLIVSSTVVNGQDKTEYIVSTDGTGDFSSIQLAVDACKSFPDARIKIFVRNGIYHEKVVIPHCNTKLSIIGESKDKTIISYDDYFDKINRGRNSTFYTYTLKVEADDFYAENLTVENNAGPVGQAVALHVEGDRCVFRNCRILGNQDTLYTGGLNSREYFKDCYIEGTTDFIFGAATVLFDSCTIFSKSNSYITAASTVKGKKFGYVFIGCKLTAASGVDKVYLGRPWRDYAKVAFLYCELGSHILPSGWSNWAGTDRDKTASFAECGNTGTGADYSKRIAWSHQLSKTEAAQYKIKNILAPEPPDELSPDKWILGND